MNCENCKQPATFHITLARHYTCCEEHHFCEDHAHEFLYPQLQAPVSGQPGKLEGEIHVDIEKVIISEGHEQQVIVFQEVDGARSFPLVCGIFEATCIDRHLKGFASPRPLTHDALAATITAMGGKLKDVVISELRDHTYFAKFRIKGAGSTGLVEVDVRPSDAAALAVTCAVPIFIAADVMRLACGPD